MIGVVRHGFRLARAGFAFAREGVPDLVDPLALPAPARLALRAVRLLKRRSAGDEAARLSAALARLGPSYVKLGQFLATRPDVVGPRIARDLELLQDRMEPFDQAVAVETIRRALGRPVEALFAAFGPPVAAASIAQVHRARIVDALGEREVAVKVLRPGVARRFRRDLETFYAVARWLERHQPRIRRLRPVAVVDTLARSVALEMDLRLEAAALSEMGENTAYDPGFRVPAVDWERTDRDVLTLAWVDGVKLSDTAALEAAGFDLPALGRLLIQSFLRHAMRDGFFHADMHPGNLFVDAAGNLVAIDFGITGRLGPKEQRFLAEILYGFIQRDYRRTAEVHFQAGYVPATESVEEFARALRAIGEPIHDRTAEEISMARLLTQLFEVTELFNMRTQPELIMLQKTMVVVEGVARTLDPRLDMWRTSEPVVREWIERNLGPVGVMGDVATAAQRLARGLAGVPELLLRAERVAARLERTAEDGLRIAPESLERVTAASARQKIWEILGLWTIAVLLGLILLLD